VAIDLQPEPLRPMLSGEAVDGVELEGCDFTAFEPAQYTALARLTQALREAYPLRAVRGHSDIASGRKTDPGPRFDWRRYEQLAMLPEALLR
jgi:AmpD protein